MPPGGGCEEGGFMRHIKWLLSAGLLLASGPGSRAQFPGPRLEGWRGPGVTGVPTGPLPPGVLPPLPYAPGVRPGGPLGGTGLMGPQVSGIPTIRDVYGDLFRGGP